MAGAAVGSLVLSIAKLAPCMRSLAWTLTKMP
jgi:hypothetical protein